MGYRAYVFTVASHWPAREGKDGQPGTPESHEVACGVRRLGPGTTLATWRVRVPAGTPVPTLSDMFAGADWQEREQYDLIGVVFEGHPDLRRIMLPEDWVGHPLRKDVPADAPAWPWR
jgi:hypothetical protein